VLSRYEWVQREHVSEAIREFKALRGLTLNLGKTRILNLRKESLEFLGFNFKVFNKGGVTYVWVQPTANALSRIKAKISEVIERSHNATSLELIEELNPIIRGWTEFHRYPSSARN
jgi:RNA-directed DNA polymerase